jgi:hypothetical protein
MASRVHRIVGALAALILVSALAACGTGSSAGNAAPTSETSPTSPDTATMTATATVSPTASPTIAPSATPTQTAVPPTATADGTPSGGPKVPDAPADSPAYSAALFSVTLPSGFDLESDERIGRVREGSLLSYSRGFLAGRMQSHWASEELYAAQLECGEFRSAALAHDALMALVDYSSSALAASQGFVTDEVEIEPLGDASAAVLGTLDAEGISVDVAEAWYTSDTVLCTILGFADGGDPLTEVVEIAKLAAAPRT